MRRASLAIAMVVWLLGGAGASAKVLKPVFDGKDTQRPRLTVRLTPVAEGFNEPTDLHFLPKGPQVLFVLEKEGSLRWISLEGTKKRGTLLQRKVRTEIEQGLLGMAFHPRFATNRKFFIHYNPEGGARRTRVSELEMSRTPNGLPAKAANERVIFEVEQPYSNHKGGQLVFGPDGFLYIGLGDGGSGGDPHENAQNPRTMLGKMLRIDVDVRDGGKPYAVPKDNPFAGDAAYLPEIWALGLRNPWRYSFLPDGRLLAADVGQWDWEELSVIKRGGNYGWAHREGAHCFKLKSGCRRDGLTDPVLEYGREDGGSVIGGFVQTGGRADAPLLGKYVFGDYVSGRIWAADLDFKRWYSLGRWPIQPSTFGRDRDGIVYVADFDRGAVYRID